MKILWIACQNYLRCMMKPFKEYICQFLCTCICTNSKHTCIMHVYTCFWFSYICNSFVSTYTGNGKVRMLAFAHMHVHQFNAHVHNTHFFGFSVIHNSVVFTYKLYWCLWINRLGWISQELRGAGKIRKGVPTFHQDWLHTKSKDNCAPGYLRLSL